MNGISPPPLPAGGIGGGPAFGGRSLGETPPTPDPSRRREGNLPPLHATCIAIAGRAVLLTGPPGIGKSDLAFRLIDRGAELVADDGVILTPTGGHLIATCPATIAGKIELRDIGILALPYRLEAPVVLIVALDEPPVRMPDDPLPTRTLAGIAIPLIGLLAHESSAPLKVEQALLRYGLAP